MNITNTTARRANIASLTDEEEVRHVPVDSVIKLWDVVNNLTRLRPTRRDRYRVTIFGLARSRPGTLLSPSHRRLIRLLFLLIFSLSSASSYALLDDKKDKNRLEGRPVLWREPADIASRDLYLGPGGKAMKPDLSKVVFVKEEAGGYSNKYDVIDGAGRKWTAKLGKEAQSEAAANRLMWGVGFNTEICYLVPQVTIEGKGSFQNVRFEARPKHIERAGIWKWDANPFKGRREFQALKVIMILLENWDIKDVNNKILIVRNKQTGQNESHYIISDLGGTFGKTGGWISRSRNEPEDYAKAKFIKGVKGNFVEFHYGGKRQGLFKDITVEQARWAGNLLSRLSQRQIRDALRAANYTVGEIRMLTEALTSRINELKSLGGRRGEGEPYIDRGRFSR